MDKIIMAAAAKKVEKVQTAPNVATPPRPVSETTEFAG
jgi:hypothetical protein